MWVAGEKVWEYRGEADALELRLPAGAHLVEVKDFRDQDTWGSGTLDLSPGDAATLHFSMSDPIATKGGSWQPAQE